ncbi:ABC transporter permease [Tessaracoccus palaemonis]|uniref:Autoinducer 2 import system permease protein LsrD n=2 Tax=Tessaracoccus palaemonis TaxID=2829499 RepID=A0ABX8SHW0_9ACTN|nr:ABC transporter permease [Tessaracoccus palaemonis]
MMSETTAPRTYKDFAQPIVRRLLLTRESAIIALLIVVLIGASLIVPSFASAATATYLMLDVATILLISLVMAPIMITGDIDLSVGSMVGLSSVVFGVAFQAGLPVPVGIVFALVVGAVGGLFNGWLITHIDLPALAVTIGTMALFRGIAVGLLGTTAVTGFPQEWTKLARAKIGDSPIPVIMILFVVLLIGAVWMLHFSKFGRGIFAIGLSKEAAAFSGVDVARTRLILFVLSGTIAALAGVYFTLRYGSARGDNATGLELQVIAAVVLGGVSVFGGRGALHGVIAGVFLIGALSSALRLANVTSDVINIITGVLLVASVIASSVLDWFKRQRARRALRSATQQPVTAG